MPLGKIENHPGFSVLDQGYPEEGITVRMLRVLRVETRNDEVWGCDFVVGGVCVCGGAQVVPAHLPLACAVSSLHSPPTPHRSSPMAYPAVRSLPKLPLPLRPEAEYLIVGLHVRPVGHQAQSLVIALRSPATKRSSDLNRYSPDILFRLFRS